MPTNVDFPDSPKTSLATTLEVRQSMLVAYSFYDIATAASHDGLTASQA